ncbi:MAG: glycosyltransferase [Bacteriovoracaceae bacterium]|nr:glycosyltransferase [Bacteriovoracaceae bacterium]
MKPKVLFVSINFFSPEYLDGANKITYNLLKEKELYDCSFLSLFQGELSLEEKSTFSHVDISYLRTKKPSLEKFFRYLRWIRGHSLGSMIKAEAIRLADAIEERAEFVDIIYLTNFGTASCMSYLSKKTLKKIILGAIDSYSMYTKRRVGNEKRSITKGLFKRELRFAMKFERWAYSLSPKTIFVSPIDEEYSRENFPEGNYTNIPLGVDTEYFHPAPREIEINPQQIIFTGNLSYAPNRDACNFLVFEVLTLLRQEFPKIKLILAGSNPPPEIRSLNDTNILVTGQVPDLRPYIWESALFVCPLRFGAGMKNKVLELLSMEKESIFSDIALEGIESIDDLICIDSKAPASAYAKEIKDRLNQSNNPIAKLSSYRNIIKEQLSLKAQRNRYYELFLEQIPSLKKIK